MDRLEREYLDRLEGDDDHDEDLSDLIGDLEHDYYKELEDENE